ncbi:DUF692 domain-containing protein [Pokkaliibacter sp. CJK22405]|uniref:MNIO family bufferin maturase n=1 Tax=Pokkaliibacter sp. CJK22405 TaxID=3384615 RepID=UPI00398464C1
MSNVFTSKTPALASLGLGAGLRSCHLPYLEKHLSPELAGVDWFEAITENVLDHQGYARDFLFRLREHFPVVLHGVSLSIGSTDPLNRDYLKKLRALADSLSPAWISDHLCWTGIQGLNSHDLLPMPLTHESLTHTLERIDQVQEMLGRPLVLENPSSYLAFSRNDYPEWEFLAELVKRSGCLLLVDVNNIHVSSVNLGFDRLEYLHALPAEAIVQCHIAGPTDMGSHLIDTHDQPVPTPVWELYQALLAHCDRPVSTLLEWDANIPDFPDLVEELYLARDVMAGRIPKRRTATASEGSQLSTPIAAGIEASSFTLWEASA